MFSETQDLFRFLLEMGKSCPKELFKIARCFRSYFVSLFESFQKVTERSRMLVTIQTRILNTFSKQGTKIIQGNIMCVSNFHMDMFGNVLKFWCYDPNLCSSGHADSIVFPPYIAFCLTVTYCFLLLAIRNKPLSLRSCHEAQNTFFVIQVILFFFFGFVFFVIFTEGGKEERLLPVFEAMDHRNLHYHTALQVVHQTRNKSGNNFT